MSTYSTPNWPAKSQNSGLINLDCDPGTCYLTLNLARHNLYLHSNKRTLLAFTRRNAQKLELIELYRQHMVGYRLKNL